MKSIIKYDKTKVQSSEQSLNQMKFYSVESKKNKMYASLIDGLNKLSFKDSLYNKVVEGSKRWWVLERMKFDYNTFYSKNNHLLISNQSVENHESLWKKKVEEFYFKLDNGYIESSKTESTEKVPSKYMLNKYYDSTNKIELDKIYNMGLDKEGKPIFYTIIYDENNEAVDIRCKVTFDHIASSIKCEKLSETWWLVKRMQFDYGNKYHPVTPNGIKGDWKGVVYRFNELYKSTDGSFIEYQQDAWKRYVDGVFEYLNSPKTETLTIEDKLRHNCFIVSHFDSTTINDMIKNHPYLVLRFLPSNLYQYFLNTIIDTAVDNDRFRTKDMDLCIDDVTSPIKMMISKFKYVDSISCEKFDKSSIEKLLMYHPNDFKGFFDYIIYQCISLNMIDNRYIDAIKLDSNKFFIEDLYVDKPVSLADQLAFFDVMRSDMITVGNEDDDSIFCKENNMFDI